MQRPRSERARNLPPLLVTAVAMLALLAVLPSALNIPQTNPGETLEYAPVPPDDEQPPAATPGNFSSLGLGSSSSIGGAAPDDDLAPPPVGGPGVGRTPSTKRCVGTPPRQTADPMSPPCVAHFSGDNGGTTYQGVTSDEVRVLIYIDTCGGGEDGDCTCDASSDPGPCPNAGYHDLAEPPKGSQKYGMESMRIYQRFFNERFQTYGRFVHLFVFFSFDQATATPERRRADAADNVKAIKPFAVVNLTLFAAAAYDEVMASKGVVVFRGPLNLSSAVGIEEEYYRRYPKLIWSVGPSIEQRARQYSDLVCSEVVNRPVTFAGDATYQGRPRKLGYLTTNDPAWPSQHTFQRLVKQQIQACGGVFAAEGTYASICGPCFGSGGEEAMNAASQFKASEITTIIWPGGLNDTFTVAASSVRYFPEIVLAGDGASDSSPGGTVQSQDVWANAIAATGYVRADVPGERPCYQAAKEADPEVGDREVQLNGCGIYDSMLQLFTGIQVAGPKLNPASLDKGYHAIPPLASPDPRVPACYYEPGDYTCIKDASIGWWDPTGRDPAGNSPGCWRMMDDGKRYLRGTWPERDLAARKRAGVDICNSQSPTLP
ncbi:MAG TPA: hypothetical protein VMY88_05485 [Acidimicrobiales bacterium]|nr:hypothetical protein [Acidimicrobiales bacterium]